MRFGEKRTRRSRNMRGRWSIEHKSGLGRRREPWGRPGDPGRFFGLDAEELDPKARVMVALVVLAPVVLSGVFLVTFVPGLWWIFTIYGWMAFPAFGLLLRGLAGSSKSRAVHASPDTKERELIEALAREGELTPVLAAMETTLSVAEADGMLKRLAEGGHLELRACGGGLYYALWGHGPQRQATLGEGDREAEARAVTGGKKGAA